MLAELTSTRSRSQPTLDNQYRVRESENLRSGRVRILKKQLSVK